MYCNTILYITFFRIFTKNRMTIFRLKAKEFKVISISNLI